MAIPIHPLRRRLEAALPLLPRKLPSDLDGVDVILIDHATMVRVHRDFLGEATETDVITFPYGEILVCPAVAQDRAASFGHKMEHEVLLYALHGLLHLCGYDDTTARKAKEMAEAQERLLSATLKA